MLRGIENQKPNSKNKLPNSKIKQSLKFITDFWVEFYNRAYSAIYWLGKKLGKMGVSANFVTIVGFLIGVFAVNFLAIESYFYALLFILLNRFFDMLDGAIAKSTKVTEFGIFLDACLDYIFYAFVIFGFALARDENAVAASFLLFAFASSAFAMLAYAVIAYRNSALSRVDLKRSPFYLAGAAQGFETFIAFVILCLIPGWFVPVAIILGILCLFKAISLMATAYYSFVIAKKND